MSSSKTALAIELFAGLHGWGEGLSAAGFRVVGFDIVDMPRLLNHPVPERCSLVLQDVRTLHGSQFRDAHLIVASPPCQAFSFRAQPWKVGKAKHPKVLGLPIPAWWKLPEPKMSPEEFAEWSEWKRKYPADPPSTELFDACFRIQREASEAAGRYIPLVIENVRGAQPWVGRAKWNYGSYYLWGDVPALMPTTLAPAKVAGLPNGGFPGGGLAQGYLDRQAQKVPGMNFHDYEKTGKPGRSFQSAAVKQHGSGAARFDKALDERRKDAAAVKNGKDWFGSGENCSLQRKASSGSTSRRAASALIAKIPLALAEHIGRVYFPRPEERIA